MSVSTAEFDVVIRNGWIVDGSGSEPFNGSIGVAGDRIAYVGREPVTGGRTIDGNGLVIAPGFVDMHVHSDLAVVTDEVRESQVRQGVTTEVIGQDGLSYAPVSDATLEVMQDLLAVWNGRPDLEFSWRTVGEYLDHIDRRSRLNAAYLVPHGTVRHLVMGMEDRPASDEEVRQMAHLVGDGIRQGAVGMSVGLTYVPGMYATNDEIIALCGVVRDLGGVFVPHHRNYGGRAMEAYDECVSIARSSRVALHLAHAHLGFKQNAGRARELLDHLDRARSVGVEVSLDSYPYGPAATSLAALLPPWVLSLSPDARSAALATNAAQERVQREMEAGTPGHMGEPIDWGRVSISSVSNATLRQYVGLTLAQIYTQRGVGPGTAVCELLQADGFSTGAIIDIGNEDNVRTIAQSKFHTASSDGMFVGDRPHPRAFGSMARFLARFVRDEGLIPIEEAIRHMTSSPMQVLGIRDRGLLRVGYFADLCVFDPQTFEDRATFDDPRRTAVGMDTVVVNGIVVLQNGELISGTPGRALRHQRRPDRPQGGR